MALFELQGLTTSFRTDEGTIWPSRAVSFAIERGEVVGLVGESGSGKSVTAKAALRLIEPESAVVGGAVLYRGRDLLTLSAAEMEKLRARDLAMIFQDPTASLNPVLTIGEQISRVYALHGEHPSQARAQAIALLQRVRIPDAEARLAQYPHQFSGGMQQRVMIAMALICRPALLVADEPTTALDVTVEAQVIALLKDLQRELGMAVLFISHNLGVVATLCDRVVVMYAGQVVESAPVIDIFERPQHPYTRALLASIPHGKRRRAGGLRPIQGEPPNLAALPEGCPFQPRCGFRQPACAGPQPLREVAPGALVACHRAPLEDAALA